VEGSWEGARLEANQARSGGGGVWAGDSRGFFLLSVFSLLGYGRVPPPGSQAGAA
jgi:hypothetical protein